MNNGASIWLFVILALNFGISWWNARTCGRAWLESKAVGGTIRVLVWCGATAVLAQNNKLLEAKHKARPAEDL